MSILDEFMGAEQNEQPPISASQPGLPPANQLLDAILNNQQAANVNFVVTRNYAGYPEQITGDIDLIVLPEDLEKVFRYIAEIASQLGWQLFYALKRPYVYYLGFCTPVFPERPVLIIELFTGGVWYDNAFLDARQVFATSLAYKTFRVPTPAHEAVLILFHHLLWNRKVPAKYRDYIREKCLAHPVEFQSALQSAFGEKLASLALAAVQSENWQALVDAHRNYLIRLNLTRCLQNPVKYAYGWAKTIYSQRQIQAGLLFFIRADDSEWQSKLLQAMEDLADKWHIFLPGFRKFLVLSDVSAHALTDLLQNTIKGVNRGGVLAIALPEGIAIPEACPRYSLIEYRDHQLFVDHQPPPAYENNLDYPQLAALMWQTLLTNYAE